MIRNLIVIAVASFVLTIICAAGVVALGGRDLVQHGWTFPANIRVSEGDRGEDVHITVGGQDELGPQTTRDIPWAGGPSLSINLPAEVSYSQGPVAKVTVTGPRALVDRVAIVDGGLRFTPEGGESRVTVNGHGFNIDTVREGLKITVVAPAVTKFVLNGSPSLSLTGYDQPELVLEINGSGDVSGTGKTQTLALSIAGSGEAGLAGLQARDASVSVTGSGNAEVLASGAVQVSIAGSGDVTLTAKPASLTSNIDGSGDLHLQ
ncbi:MAG: GIN domain-containing protein [Caulobacter sp.]